jgi:hypothetical protein
MDMQLVADRLSEVKAELLKLVQDGNASPTIQHMTQVTIDHLDTTYLWARETFTVQKIMAKGTDERAEAAVAAGEVKEIDFAGEVGKKDG